MQPSTIEVVTFKLNKTATTDQLAATNEAMSAFLLEQSGFIYRSLSVDENNLWHDIIYWKTPEDMTKAGEQFMQSEVGKSIMALVDDSSATMRKMTAFSEAYHETEAA